MIYDKKNFLNNYFNYRISKRRSSNVNDEEWNIKLFSNKLNYLRKDVNYEMATHPQFLRGDKGELLAQWRNGGLGSGNEVFAKYDGKEWSDTRILFIGKKTEIKRGYSVCGDYKLINGYLSAGFVIRYNDFRDNNPDYELNSG